MIFSMLTHYHYLNASIFMTFDWIVSRGWMRRTTTNNSDGPKTMMMMTIGSRNGSTILVRLILLSIPFFDFFFLLLFILFISYYVKWRKKTKEMNIKLPVYSREDSSYTLWPKSWINAHRGPTKYSNFRLECPGTISSNIEVATIKRLRGQREKFN